MDGWMDGWREGGREGTCRSSTLGCMLWTFLSAGMKIQVAETAPAAAAMRRCVDCVRAVSFWNGFMESLCGPRSDARRPGSSKGGAGGGHEKVQGWRGVR
jgi:hypothetical protein